MNVPPPDSTKRSSNSPVNFEHEKSTTENVAKRIIPAANSEGKKFTAKQATETKVQTETQKIAKIAFSKAA